MKKDLIAYLFVALFFSALKVSAQDEKPKIDPTAYVSENGGEEKEGTVHTGSAPLHVRLDPQVENEGTCTPYYEWRFYKEGGSIDKPYLVRHEKETEVTLLESGTHCIALIAYFTEGNDTIEKFDEEHWRTATPIRITVSESILEFPNAFSPNGDEKNDVYKAKKGFKSIVEFKAAIYNRWGQKLFEWTNPAEGWDGTFNGRDVKQGVYYVNVQAKGADGRVFNIRKDVNLLRGLNETSGSSSSGR